MCGIAGLWSLKSKPNADQLQSWLSQISTPLAKRGPDSHGEWVDAEYGIALAHRRLAIVDLSPAGHQPMISASGRYVITYNGEVYNFADLRRDKALAATSFRGGSDTEVILAGFDAWGISATLQKTIGMFAIAVWDKQDKTLTLARDRLGIKPLYWGMQDNLLIFGSQPKVFASHPLWQKRISNDALSSYLEFNYVPAPLSIYRDVKQLMPGHMVTINNSGSANDLCFWNPYDLAKHANEIDSLSDSEAVANLETLLKDAVSKRMIADVPLGAFLSGGVDSSLVVALMQAQSSSPVKTFTIGFSEAQYNEAQHAKEVAKALGTEHTELYVSPNQALAMVSELPESFDEPFADSSQIPTLLVSQLTRKKVTVSLSGDGGDELFAGYNRYLVAQKLKTVFKYAPYPLRIAAAKLIETVPGSLWDSVSGLIPAKRRPRLFSEKMQKIARVIGAKDFTRMYNLIVSGWSSQDILLNQNSAGAFKPPAIDPSRADLVAQMQFLDLITYLPNDILAKVDRASMAYGLEARVPIIDHRVVEMAWKLPQRFKLRDGQSKWILRQILYKYVPRHLIERPKMGFGVPIDMWLRGPLRDWAQDLLSETKIKDDGFFNPAKVEKIWQEHLSGKFNWHSQLWTVLMFQSWKQRWLK